MSIKKLLYHNQNGDPVYQFRIPNQTGDYVEFTNLGCKICGVHVHKLDGTMENIFAAFSAPDSGSQVSKSGVLIGGDLGVSLYDKVWKVAEEGKDNIFLTYECVAAENNYNIDLQLGVNITWVNLNRLIIDLFLTPREKVSINFSSYFFIDAKNRDFAMRSFCPMVKNTAGDYLEVSETPFHDMKFVSVKNNTDVFLNSSDDIKPMLEFSDRNSALRISAYSTLTSISARDALCQEENTLSIIHAGKNPVDLKAGETLANRIIYGFDYIEEMPEDNTEPNPFSFFL